MPEELLKKVEKKSLEELIFRIDIIADLANELKLMLDAINERTVINSAEMFEKVGTVINEISTEKTIELVRELNKNADKLLTLLKALNGLNEQSIPLLIDLANFLKLIQDVLTEDMVIRNTEMLERLVRLISKINDEKIISKLERLINSLKNVDEKKLEKLISILSMLDEKTLDILTKLDSNAIEILEKFIDMLKTKEMKLMLDSLFDKSVLKTLNALLIAVKETDFKKPEIKVGVLNAIGLLKDPDMQKFLGAMVTLAKNFRRNL